MKSSEKISLGTLYVIAAASGSGKTSLVKALVESMPKLAVSISYTTRPPRDGEQHGVHYFFISTEQFEEMIAQSQFLEYARVFGHYYGTSKDWVHDHLRQGFDVILEIDWQGAQQVKTRVPASLGIFIFPPSLEVLRNRLCTRNLDSEEVIEKRFLEASNEISHFKEFDFLVVNDVFEKALFDLKSIIQAQRLRVNVQIERHAHLLANLLKTK